MKDLYLYMIVGLFVLFLLSFMFSNQQPIIFIQSKDAIAETSKSKKNEKPKEFVSMYKYEETFNDIPMMKNDAYQFIGIPMNILQHKKGMIRVTVHYEFKDEEYCTKKNNNSIDFLTNNHTVVLSQTLSSKTARRGFHAHQGGDVSNVRFSLLCSTEGLVLLSEDNERDMKVTINIVIHSPIKSKVQMKKIVQAKSFVDIADDEESTDDE